MILQWFVLLPAICAFGSAHRCGEDVRANTDSGWVCGVKRTAQDGSAYASFRGVPYAKQPIGDLRFKELQPSEPWSGCLNASVDGPACPYHKIAYEGIKKPLAVSEACIYANIHVPLHPKRGIQWPGPGLPIVVYIHGGIWSDGSGGTDLCGPEYLVSKNVLIITFNYRLAVLGFLSLNTPKVPGNNGLRDMVTLLRWVQTNARNFGGNPCEVTLAGQSAGAASAHLLSMSPYTQGLFKRIWLMSGNAVQHFFTTSPKYAEQATNIFLTTLGMNTTDYDEVHDQLIQMPLDVIMNASATVLSQFGIACFVPVRESKFPNITAIISDDPELLLSAGYGNNIPMVIGFTSVEAETIRRRLEEVNILEIYAKNKAVGLPANFLYKYSEDAIAIMAQKLYDRYFGNETVTMDRYIKMVSDVFFASAAAKVVSIRSANRGAPVYFFKFSYNTKNAVFKVAYGLNYTGAGHHDDLFTIFKVNSLAIPTSKSDEDMTEWMTDLFSNFIKHGDPTYGSCACAWPAEAEEHAEEEADEGEEYSLCDSADESGDCEWPWPAVEQGRLWYQNITSPEYSYIPLTDDDQEMVEFYDNLAKI